MAGPGWDRTRWLHRARIAAIALALLLATYALVGFLVLPGIVKSVAERQSTEQLGRKTTIGHVALNPFTLAVTVDDFRLYEADGTTVAVTVRSLFADASSASLFRRALVFDRLQVRDPVVKFARLGPQRFSFSDIVDRLAAKPKPDRPTLFSINNIELDGGAIDVDDRVTGRRHRVERLTLALPFLSNLPYDTAIFVTPRFAATVDGSAITLDGKAQPFSTTRETAVDIVVSDIELPDYVDLSPTPLPFALRSGKLTARLAIAFRAATRDAGGRTVPQSTRIAGHVGVATLDVADRGGRSVATAKSIDVDIASIDPFGGDVSIDRIAIVAPHVDATRRADGRIDLAEMFRPGAPAATSATPATTPAAATPAAPAPVRRIGSVRIDDGSLRFVDENVASPVTTQLKKVTLTADTIALDGDTPTTFRLSLATDDDATLDVAGSAVIAKRQASGTVRIERFDLRRAAPYVDTPLAARIEAGRLDAEARYAIDASGAAPGGTIDAIALRVAGLRTSLPDAPKSPLFGADSIVLDGGRVDLPGRAFAATSLKLVAPVVAVARDAKGRWNFSRGTVEPATASPDATSAAAPFRVAIGALAIERGDVAFDDLAGGAAVHLRAQPLDVTASNVGTDAAAVVPFKLATTIDRRGKLAVDGRIVLDPLTVDATIDATAVPIGWLAAYSGDRLNVRIESADLDTKGTLRVARARGAASSSTPAPAVAYRGTAGLSRVRVLDKATSDEFVRWKSLATPQLGFEMPAKAAPFALTLGTVALDDFYARLIVNANGRLNLQDVVATPGSERSVTTPGATGRTTEATTGATTEATSASPNAAAIKRDARPASPTGPSSSSPSGSIRVAGIALAAGRIGITDNFIRPNYSANITALEGRVSAIASDDRTPTTLKLSGRIDGDGSLDVDGRVDPFSPLRLTDVSAVAKDIELTRLSPYAIKYAGYAIERGKLSTTVRYHIENGTLDASNRLFLDQLTFGDKVENTTATKLPVLLAVSLLKNARGEIDLNLPVTGSLSDPQFSVAGVIGRVLVNLIARAVTSPFSLIASAVGRTGGGAADELGYVQFKPGVSELAPQGKAKLETLAKALSDRPALKLDIIGRFDPATDPAGIRRDHLLDRLKDLKAKDRSKGGEHVGRDDVTVEPDEYASLLARVYDDTKLPDKPRNAIGLAKTLPTAEMERLLLANIVLDDNDPRWLAEARADVVRHYIEDTGKVAASRVFLVTPKLNADGIDDQGVATRVDFALR